MQVRCAGVRVGATHPLTSALLQTRCEKCKHLPPFKDKNALQEHYNRSPSVHPHCRVCDLGFASMPQFVSVREQHEWAIEC